jgi:hypothetical protein
VDARRFVLALLAVTTLLAAPAATAKDFAPGDLRVCSGQRCVPITSRPLLKPLGAFYYTGRKPPVVASAPHLGAPAFELRFRNGYATGIVATAKLDRFLSYGVNLGWFTRGQWYRLPSSVARELRTLAAPLEPLRVTHALLARSR